MYVRDKRSPTPKSEAVSRVMSANRAKNSTPEMTLRRALWAAGLRGYRLHYRIKLKNSPPCLGGVAAGRGGSSEKALVSPNSPLSTRNSPLSSVRPDITFVSRKLAIFVHGCF